MSFINHTYSVYELVLDLPAPGVVSTKLRVFDERSMHAAHTAIASKCFGKAHKSRYILQLIKQDEYGLDVPYMLPFFTKGAQCNVWYRNPVLDVLYSPVDSTGYNARTYNRIWVDGDGVMVDYCPAPIWELACNLARARDPHYTSIHMECVRDVSHLSWKLVSKRSRPFDGTYRVAADFLTFEDGRVAIVDKE